VSLRRAAALLALSFIVAAALAARGHGPEQSGEFARDILAQGRVFPGIGPGANALKRDAAGNYYILASPATAIAVYGPDGKRAGQIPNANSGSTKIVYAADLDIDAGGRLLVADRGANAVRIFMPDGAPAGTIRVVAPTSIVALSGNEIAVASLLSDHLVDVIDETGKVVRGFGDVASLSGGTDANRLLSRGRIMGDAAGYIYFAFTYLPDPTIRKYDRFGYSSYEIALSAQEFAPVETRKRDPLRIERHTDPAPPDKPIVNAIGVAPTTQEVWVAIGNELIHFDKEGRRRASYHTLTKEGARLEPKAILVEPERLLLAADPHGIFEFARPDKTAAAPDH
jgi:hypothetical protein